MEELRRRLEAYFESCERERYCAAQSGGDASAALEEVDERFADLSSGDPLEALHRALDAGRGTAGQEAGRRLLRAVESAYLAAQGRRLGRELRVREAGQRVRVGAVFDGVSIWRARLRTESTAGRRAEIQGAIDAARGELDELREELLVRLGEARAELGYATGRARAEALYPDADFEGWGARAHALLENTEGAYRDALNTAQQRAGVRADEAGQGDIDWVHRMEVFDRAFAPGRLTGLLDYTTGAMGLGLSEIPGLEFEYASERGLPVVSCFPLRAPGEIVVLSRLHSGVDAARGLFGAAGRAFHYAFMSPSLPVERRRVMDRALGAGFALLLEGLIGDPAWIEESPAQLRGEEFAHGVRLRQLLYLRRCAAQVDLELALSELAAGHDPRALAAPHAESLTVATGYAHSTAGYLIGADPELGSVHRLRAHCLAAQLRSSLRSSFGWRFWRERSAGELLKELWNTGTTYSADALASELDFAPLDVAPLLEDVLNR